MQQQDTQEFNWDGEARQHYKKVLAAKRAAG